MKACLPDGRPAISLGAAFIMANNEYQPEGFVFRSLRFLLRQTVDHVIALVIAFLVIGVIAWASPAPLFWLSVAIVGAVTFIVVVLFWFPSSDGPSKDA